MKGRPRRFWWPIIIVTTTAKLLTVVTPVSSVGRSSSLAIIPKRFIWVLLNKDHVYSKLFIFGLLLHKFMKQHKAISLNKLCHVLRLSPLISGYLPDEAVDNAGYRLEKPFTSPLVADPYLWRSFPDEAVDKAGYRLERPFTSPLVADPRR